MKSANHAGFILHCSRVSQAHCQDKAENLKPMRVYRYGLSTLLNEDAMKLPSLLFSLQGRINRLPYQSAAVLVVHTRHLWDWQWLRTSKQYGPDNPMKIVHGIIVLAAFALAVWIGLAG